MKKMHCFVVLAYKESEYLEECIKSVLDQKYISDVVIATSTPNDYINKIAKKYNLKVLINVKSGAGIESDYNFAINCTNYKLLTIAHQDDIYDYDYSYNIVNEFKKNNNALILFSDYYEVKGNQKIKINLNLKIKRILLFPLRFRNISNSKFVKRLSISFGCTICCPSVTYVKDNLKEIVFLSNFKAIGDWAAWERLSNQKGTFIYLPKKLMGHRIHDGSSTTELIRENIRTKEDLEMFKKFWPAPLAKLINKFYAKAEKSNNL